MREVLFQNLTTQDYRYLHFDTFLINTLKMSLLQNVSMHKMSLIPVRLVFQYTWPWNWVILLWTEQSLLRQVWVYELPDSVQLKVLLYLEKTRLNRCDGGRCWSLTHIHISGSAPLVSSHQHHSAPSLHGNASHVCISVRCVHYSPNLPPTVSLSIFQLYLWSSAAAFSRCLTDEARYREEYKEKTNDSSYTAQETSK